MDQLQLQYGHTIEQNIGELITMFSYPYAFPDADNSFVHYLKSVLKGAGYTCAVTTQIGTTRPGDDVYKLKRIPINTLDDLRLFHAKLIGAYDCMAGPQRIAKKLKHWKRHLCPAAGMRRQFQKPFILHDHSVHFYLSD